MIFVDTSFWIAGGMARDARHPEALALAERHRSAVWITTNHVRGETWTFLRRRGGHRMAVAYLDRLDRSALVEVAHVDDELEGEALRWVRRHEERKYSFVDGTSFVLMRRLGIGEALAFDGDFAAAGFVELRA